MTGVPPVLADDRGFVERLGEGWGATRRRADVPPGLAQSTARHRALLSAELPGVTIVVHAGGAFVRNNDAMFPFRADSDFLWLTGCDVDGAVLVMTPHGTGHDALLHLPAPPAPGSAAFIRDSQHSELWVGPSPDLAGWSDALGMPVAPLESLRESGIRAAGAALAVAGRPAGTAPDAPAPSARLKSMISELRMIKDPWEIDELRAAVASTVAGFEAVAAELPTAMTFGGERWLQGTFDRHARTHGNGPGYLSIVAAGSHAPVAHWTRCDGGIEPDQLVLLDAGVETRAYYTADITRTFPAGGSFSRPQRLVHDLVQKAHEAALASIRTGREYSVFHHTAMEVIANGLHDWGLLPVSVDEALSSTGQHHRRYLVCGVGHHLGLDVHDCAAVPRDAYRGGPLRENMVVTVEPGLYFHENDLTLPPELRGIGVRIEDDVLVTPEGAQVLSTGLPIDADGLEQWVRTHSRPAMAPA